MRFSSIHLTPISEEVLKMSIRQKSLENEFVNLLPYLPGASELMGAVGVVHLDGIFGVYFRDWSWEGGSLGNSVRK